jgi:Ca2+-binding EF-hand superfamily protein
MKIKYLVSTLSILGMLGVTTAYAHDDQNHERAKEAFEQADTNKDGKISYEEFRIAHEKRLEAIFKKMDTDGDGFIDEAERKDFHEKMREKWHEHHHGHCKEWKHRSKEEGQ